jgi:hypothetical protein
MADIAHIMEMLDDLIVRFEQLKAEVAKLQGETGTAASSSLQTAPSNVIPPTRTDDPDSIVGGRPVRRGDFPDCCAVGDETEYYCSGTLIAPNVVVTAGHCDYATRVFLNGNDVDHPADEAQVINIKRVTDENGFESLLDFRHPNPKVDLRVLVLEQDSKVQPRRVAREGDLDGVDEAMLVGFGMIDLAGTKGYGVKRQVVVPLETLDCTEEEIAGRRGCREGYEIVAGHRGLLRDTCRGDSGGPLYIEAEDGSYLLLGATSRGAWGKDNQCGDGGVYVRVDKFLDWIEEVTGVEI